MMLGYRVVCEIRSWCYFASRPGCQFSPFGAGPSRLGQQWTSDPGRRDHWNEQFSNQYLILGFEMPIYAGRGYALDDPTGVRKTLSKPDNALDQPMS